MELITGVQNDNSSGDPHVLAVDDSVVDRKVIEKLLKTSSYKVTTVDSGRKAPEFLGLGDDYNAVNEKNELKVNMIITDYCMPGMTGYELLKRIKQSELKEIPVVMMSSENEPSRIRRCLDEGAEDFILKPVKSCEGSIQIWFVNRVCKLYKNFSRGNSFAVKITIHAMFASISPEEFAGCREASFVNF